MSTAVSSWTCPQCGRRVPGREPLCHCGFPRTNAPAAGLSVAARPLSPVFEVRRLAVLVGALVAGVVGVLVYVAVRPRDQNLAAVPGLRPRIRGQVGYPALPPLPTVKGRRGRPQGTAAVAPAPNVAKLPTAAAPADRAAPNSMEQEWVRAKELLDLPLRKIAADTSVLELSYRPFAESCVDSAGHSFARDLARDSAWLASLKTAALRSGVTLREKGATVDCETARKGLIARADALKSDLDATEKVAYANGVLPAHWRKLLVTHELEVWDRY